MIGYGMLYAVAVGVPILAAVLVISAFLRRHGRAERGVWIAGLVLALALPVLTLTRPPTDGAPAPAPMVERGPIGLPATVVVPEVTVVSVPVARSAAGLDAIPIGLDEILVGLWVLASIALVIRWAVATARLARRVRGCPTRTVDGVGVSLTSELGPAVAGWVRPRILVPLWLMSLPRHQRSLVLLHEQEHVRARDPLLMLASRIARVLTPWNPVVWMLSSGLLRGVELDCDRRVLRRRPDVEAYGTTLLTVSSRDPGALVGAAAFAESEAPLRRRILAMTTPQGTISILGLVTALVLGILLLLGAFQIPVPTVGEVDPRASGSDAVGVEQAAEIAEVRRELEARLAAQAQALAEQEATIEELTALREQLRRLEESQARATRRAEATEALLEELARERTAERPEDRSREASGFTATALTGTVTGIVRDKNSDRPLENVQIFLRDLAIGGLTNRQGRFLLLHVPVGEHEVVAERIGFRDAAQSVEVIAGAAVEVDVSLQESAVELEPLLVTGASPRPSGLPSLDSESDGASPLIYIDGIRVAGPRPSSLEDLIRPEEIDRIEIIKKEAAVELYGEEARAGVVMIFTKPEPQEEAQPLRASDPGRPTFTPFTVAPRVLNADEVRRAMSEAYPPELRAQGIGGTVRVYFFITENGDVQDYRLHESSGHEALDEAALEVAGAYRFSPALNRDERVAVWVAFPITFVVTG